MKLLEEELYELNRSLNQTATAIGDRDFRKYFGGAISDLIKVRTTANTLAAWRGQNSSYYVVNMQKDLRCLTVEHALNYFLHIIP